MGFDNSRYNLQKLAIDLEIDINDVASLFEEFFNEMFFEMENMRKYYDEKNWEMLKRTVHNIKGVSSSLNIYDVFSQALIFDELLKQNKISDAKIYIDDIIKLIDDAKKDIFGDTKV